MLNENHKNSARAKHPQVAQAVRQRIARGTYARGMRLPHRDELELELGASRATVQTALNTLQEEGFLRGVTGQGTFVADQLPFDTDYGLLFPVASESFSRHRIFAAIQAAARDVERLGGRRIRDYFRVTDFDSADRLRVAQDATEHRLGGLIVAFNPDQLLKHYRVDLKGTPCVAISAPPRASDPAAVPSFYPDWDAFFQLAFSRLAARGRRRVAVLTCDADPLWPDRLAQLAASLGIECRPEHVQAIHPTWLHVTGRVLPLMLPDSPDRPDALIIADDNLVEIATATLLARGVRPGQLDVVAHVNLPQPATPHFPCDLLAFDIAQLLEQCIESLRAQRLGQPVAAYTPLPPRPLADHATPTLAV